MYVGVPYDILLGVSYIPGTSGPGLFHPPRYTAVLIKKILHWQHLAAAGSKTIGLLSGFWKIFFLSLSLLVQPAAEDVSRGSECPKHGIPSRAFGQQTAI